MSENALKIISNAMSSMGIEYELGTYTKKPVVYPYFVGEYQESEPMTEDGHQETTFMLNGFSRGSWADLENAKERIETYFNRVQGNIVMAEDGSAVAIFYSDALIVPTGDAELKRIQINLKIHEWKVN